MARNVYEHYTNIRLPEMGICEPKKKKKAYNILTNLKAFNEPIKTINCMKKKILNFKW